MPHKLAYEIEWGHLVLARSQVDLTPDGRRLTIDASVESGGLTSFFKPFQTIARAALEADNGRWQSRVLRCGAFLVRRALKVGLNGRPTACFWPNRLPRRLILTRCIRCRRHASGSIRSLCGYFEPS